MPTKGTYDLLKAYSASPVLQAVVRKIAYAVATVELRAEVVLPTGEQIPVPNHIMARMLNSGVPGLDGLQCRLMEAQAVELAGESFAMLRRNAFDVPFERWPVPPNWVANVPTPMGNIFEVRAQGSAVSVQVERKDMLWYKDVNPADPYRRGLGVARALTDEINVDEAAAKHTGSTLANRARPDIVISGSKEVPLLKEDAERIHEIWTQRFTGPHNAGKPFISAGPISVDQLTPSFKELQLTKLREFERDIIITVFGIPPEMVGVIVNSNRAIIDSAEFFFMKHVVLPRVKARVSTLNDQLAPQYDPNLRVGFEPFVTEDQEFKLKVMSARPKAFSKDEARELAGEEPLPDGMGQIDGGKEDGTVAASDETSIQASALNGAQIAALQGIIADVTAALMSPDAAVQLIVVSFPTISQEQAEDMVNASVSFTPAVPATGPGAKALPLQTKIFAADIEEILAAMDQGLVAEVMTSNNKAIVAEFGSETLESLNVEIAFDLRSPSVEGFLETAAGERSNLIMGTTLKNMRTELTEGVAGGENTAKLSARIRRVVTGATDARAETIVRTETVRASNFAADEAHKQAGITEKEWLTSQDDRVRDSHFAMDGQKQPVGSAFQSPDGFEAEYPGDFGIAEEDINCRCAVIPVDSAPTKDAREQSFEKIEGARGRLEQTFMTQIVAMFKKHGQQVIAALEDKG